MYTDLKSYQNALIVHDFTVGFIKRYVDRSDMSDRSYKSYSRMADQMIQAARSGKQNIAEATASSKQKPKSEPMLLGVASASLKELLEDYQDYLRQHSSTSSPQDGSSSLYKSDTTDKSYTPDRADRSYATRGLKQWDKNDPRALRVRELYKYRSNGSDRTDRSDATYQSYKTYLANAEDACNAMICLINQTTYLLDNQIRAVERQLKEKGISLESHVQKMNRIVAEERRREQEIDTMVAKFIK